MINEADDSCNFQTMTVFVPTNSGRSGSVFSNELTSHSYARVLRVRFQISRNTVPLSVKQNLYRHFKLFYIYYTLHVLHFNIISKPKAVTINIVQFFCCCDCEIKPVRVGDVCRVFRLTNHPINSNNCINFIFQLRHYKVIKFIRDEIKYYFGRRIKSVNRRYLKQTD